MQFYLTSDTSKAISDLQARLLTELQTDKQVLWVVSGGSNITASVAVMAGIPAELQTKLTILFSDERYGPVGHADSNFQQMLNAGFTVSGARFIPTLQDGLSLHETAKTYASVVQAEFEQAEIIISQLGIGADGHIAGALPGTPATESDEWASGYLSDPYQRVTMTFPALRQIDADYSLVYGDDKQTALTGLQQFELPLAQQPAQILRQLPEAYIYNDQIGDPS
jgi:6-phosphogluconolactonase/glucosamine-6-phosphate isomerase/deaminase